MHEVHAGGDAYGAELRGDLVAVSLDVGGGQGHALGVEQLDRAAGNLRGRSPVDRYAVLGVGDLEAGGGGFVGD